MHDTLRLTLSSHSLIKMLLLAVAAFFGAALVGLADDIFNIRSNGQDKAGLPSKIKPLLTPVVALIGGWPETKVTMRFWLVGQVGAVGALIGPVLFIMGRYT